MDTPDGSEASGQMAVEVLQNSLEVFKKPIQPAPRKKKKVLDEDTYVKVSLELEVSRFYFLFS